MHFPIQQLAAPPFAITWIDAPGQGILSPAAATLGWNITDADIARHVP